MKCPCLQALVVVKVFQPPIFGRIFAAFPRGIVFIAIFSIVPIGLRRSGHLDRNLSSWSLDPSIEEAAIKVLEVKEFVELIP